MLFDNQIPLNVQSGKHNFHLDLHISGEKFQNNDIIYNGQRSDLS